MTLFLTMLPLYILGNLHCMGMCGPLVAMIGQHRYRWYYFVGRTLAFSLAGGVAGGVGAVVGAVFSFYHLSAITSILFGLLIIAATVSSFSGWHLPGGRWFTTMMSRAGRWMTPLMLQDRRWPTFLFGFLTIVLPCGQTLIVYSAIALVGDVSVGLLNGLMFAFLTSPSLFFAMHLHRLFPHSKGQAKPLLATAGALVGALAIGRGLADLAVIPHLVISQAYHIVIF